MHKYYKHSAMQTHMCIYILTHLKTKCTYSKLTGLLWRFQQTKDIVCFHFGHFLSLYKRI